MPVTISKTLTLIVTRPPRIVTDTLPPAAAGVPYSFQLIAVSEAGAQSWHAGGLPAGLTCSVTGLISGTPTTSGRFDVVVSVTEG